MITIKLITCKLCGAQYYGGDRDLKLKAGNERNNPTEIYFLKLKVSKCLTCKQAEDRTKAGQKRKFYD